MRLLAKLEGKRTALAATFVALYGLLKAWGADLPEAPPGWEEVAVGLTFFALRLVTKGEQTLVKRRKG